MIDSTYKGKFGKEVEALPPILDLRASNLAGDLNEAERDGIKTKLSIVDGGTSVNSWTISFPFIWGTSNNFNWNVDKGVGSSLKAIATTDFTAAISDFGVNNEINSHQPLFVAPFNCKITNVRLMYYSATGRTFKLAIGSVSFADQSLYNVILTNPTLLHLETISAQDLRRTNKLITLTNAVVNQGDVLKFGIRDTVTQNTIAIPCTIHFNIQKT